ncbi:MAG: HNH endonuclease signature motif containing protein [bacterium]
MKCENCGNEHDGSYGSGRFCSSKCARGFSTKSKRKEINEKVSKSLRGVEPWNKNRKRVGYQFSDEDRKKAIESKTKKNKIKYRKLLEDGKLKKSDKIRKLLLEEQHNKCAICGMNPVWNDKPIVFDVDHIDGNPNNFNRDNLRAICPNCHRQTETFGGKNAYKNNSREYLKNYLSYEERVKILGYKRIKELNLNDKLKEESG